MYIWSFTSQLIGERVIKGSGYMMYMIIYLPAFSVIFEIWECVNSYRQCIWPYNTQSAYFHDQNTALRGVARIMEKNRHKLFRRGV
jgi:hypothetical protein